MKFSSTILALCLGFSLVAQTTPQSVEDPVVAAVREAYQKSQKSADPDALLKELQRLKMAYPKTDSISIDWALLGIAGRNAATIEELLTAQSDVIKSSQIKHRFELLTYATYLLSNPRNAARFPTDAILKAVEDYKTEAVALLSNPESLAGVPENERSKKLASNLVAFELHIARAQLMNDDGNAALKTLEEYSKTARLDPAYYSLLGDVYSNLKRDKEAMDAFFIAAVDGPENVSRNASEKAKALFIKMGGKETDYDAEFAHRQTMPPFLPPPFKAPENWKGKTVLAEVFTGSECPPCVGASCAFDALKETYPAKYLAILKYHVPIPGPDPMMNPATKARQDYYNVRSAPTTIIDGANLSVGGGPRLASFDIFNKIKPEINSTLAIPAEITIKATATLSGDNVRVNCEFSKVIESADYNVVLVQGEEKYKGGNGYLLHKMVVRDIETVKPSNKATVTFNFPKSEKATDEYLSNFEASRRERTPNWKWPARQNKIDRDKLKVVIFVQDKKTKQVNNAFVVDVDHQGNKK